MARDSTPDVFIVIVIVTGPGTTPGGAVARSLVAATWRGTGERIDFQARQAEAPLPISSGHEDQRQFVTKGR